MPQTPQQNQTSKKPELKIGPFPGGISVNVWLNTVQTDAGPRQLRSVTIAPRSYRDENGEWQQSGSYRPIDLPAMILALQKAYDYTATTPLPGAPPEATPADEEPPATVTPF